MVVFGRGYVGAKNETRFIKADCPRRNDHVRNGNSQFVDIYLVAMDCHRVFSSFPKNTEQNYLSYQKILALHSFSRIRSTTKFSCITVGLPCAAGCV